MNHSPFPILEFDPDRRAKLCPEQPDAPLLPEKCVITFFREALEELVRERTFPPSLIFIPKLWICPSTGWSGVVSRYASLFPLPPRRVRSAHWKNCMHWVQRNSWSAAAPAA